jgi:ATP/maltotriose-dependent transcriptional regulator MalT
METIGNEARLGNVLETEAQVALAMDDLDEADRLALAAISAAGPTGNDKAAVSAMITRGRIARRRGDAAGAVSTFEDAVAAARALGRSAQLRDCLIELSDLVAEQGDTKRAYELAREALR